ncbi:MAG: hypothetical protein M9930_19020 [Anaerolineae bacterium]|nr:hypothetical protein [Anaerolineae bacterium]
MKTNNVNRQFAVGAYARKPPTVTRYSDRRRWQSAQVDVTALRHEGEIIQFTLAVMSLLPANLQDLSYIGRLQDRARYIADSLVYYDAQAEEAL